MTERHNRLIVIVVAALVCLGLLWVSAPPVPSLFQAIPDPQAVETARLNEMARLHREEKNEMIDKMKAHGIGMPER